MSDHAILGASSAARWISCPGSVREIAALPESERSKTSIYADEGTAAHTLAERCLRNGIVPGDYIEKMDIPGKLQDWPVTQEMAEAVQVYLDEVEYHLDRFKGPAEALVERSVQPILRDDMWGTADVIIHEQYGELVVIDFKYGKGIVVETDWNDQMMYYGLGALREIGYDDVSTVTLVVVQPRADHHDGPVRRWTCGKDVLMEFADQLEAAAEATKDPDALLKAGSHCRFCPVVPTCPAQRELRLQTAVTDFESLPAVIEHPTEHVKLPDPRDPDELGRAMQVVSLLDFWCKEVRSMVRTQLESAQEVRGYKLVRTKANRAWTDEDDLKRRLGNMRGVGVDDIYTRKLKSPAQIEKIKALGARPKDRKAWVAKHAHNPEGGLAVVPESDSRDAVEAPLLTDFASPVEDSPASGSRTEGQNQHELEKLKWPLTKS